MNARRTRIVCAGLAITAVLAGSSAGLAASPGAKVKFRFSEDMVTSTAPVWGTYRVSGGIRDHGTARGSIIPVFKKVNGQAQVVALDLTQTQHGGQGSFVLKCRDSHFVLAKDGHVLKASGPCVIGSATGGYAQLAPVASTVVLPSHPRKGYTHTLRFVSARTRAA